MTLTCKWCSKPCKLTYCSRKCRDDDDGYSKHKAKGLARKLKGRRLGR